MLKTLKWIYDLGYKHAETRYYNALSEEIRNQHKRVDRLKQLLNEPSDVNSSEESAVAYRLEKIVGEVFHPIEYIEHTPEKRNRFKP